MKKPIIILINGKPETGKDYLVDNLTTYGCFKILNISTIDRIKTIAYMYGWDGRKDAGSRKLLSDLRTIGESYNDGQMIWNYIYENIKKCEEMDYDICFIHCREPHNLKKYSSILKGMDCKVYTLLIRNPEIEEIPLGEFSTSSDANVDFYPYNYIFTNEKDVMSVNKFDELITEIINQ